MHLLDLTPEWLIKQHFFGIYTKDAQGKVRLPDPSHPKNYIEDEVLQGAIDMAVERLEGIIHATIRHVEREVEFHDFDKDLWLEYARVTARHYPVVKVHSLQLVYGEGGSTIWDVPSDMLQVKGSKSLFGTIEVLPMWGVTRSYDPAMTEFFLSAISGARAPSFLKLTYDYGMDGMVDGQGKREHLPADIVYAIGLMAAILPFNILGDLVVGAGIASISQSVDGMSMSIGTTASAENAAYSARIIQYRKELEGDTIMGQPGLIASLISKWRRIPLGLL